jgi:hypothetical protein
MSHNVLVRDVGGGIYPRPVPENFLDFGAFGYILSPVEFSRCLVASLVANSTAVRASNVVTITATAHGVPSAYNGFRFYYPGSPTLAAGWVDNITVADANTITFPSTGADFASESVNSAAAFTTAVNMSSYISIPGGMIEDDTSFILHTVIGSSNTAATKTIRPYTLTASGFIATALTGTTAAVQGREWNFGMMNSTQLFGIGATVGSSALSTIITFNPLIENRITLQLTVSAAQDFIAVVSCPKIIIRK